MSDEIVAPNEGDYVVQASAADMGKLGRIIDNKFQIIIPLTSLTNGFAEAHKRAKDGGRVFLSTGNPPTYTLQNH